MIDTAKLIDELKLAGMPEPQAKALTNALNSVLRERMASKLDLDNLYWKVTGTVTGVLLVHFIGLYYYLGNKLDGIQQQLFTLASKLSG